MSCIGGSSVIWGFNLFNWPGMRFYRSFCILDAVQFGGVYLRECAFNLLLTNTLVF